MQITTANQKAVPIFSGLVNVVVFSVLFSVSLL